MTTLRQRLPAAVLALGLALIVGLAMATPTLGSAATTPPATPTETPTPTQTARVQIVIATAQPSPRLTPSPSPRLTPSPSPTPATVIGGVGSNGDSGGASSDCPPGVLHIPFPLGNGICVDWGLIISQAFDAAMTNAKTAIADQVKQLYDGILGPLTHTPNLRTNQEVTRVQGVLSQNATDAVVVLFGIAVLWCVQPRFFGDIAQGVSLLWRSALVVATLRTLNPLMDLWFGVVNALAIDVGHANLANGVHTALTLFLAPILLVLAGLERAVTLYTFGLTYVVAPIFIVLFIWPPAHRAAATWLVTFISLSLLGVVYGIATLLIVAMGAEATGVWGEVMLLGGLFFLTLLPAIWAGLTVVGAIKSSGALSKIIDTAKSAAGEGA